jgi:hypothetical protein
MGHLTVAGRKGRRLEPARREGLGLEALGTLETSGGVCAKTAACIDSARGTAWGMCGKFRAFQG